MTHIGILEYHYHSIFYYTLAKISNTKNTKVTLFTTEKIYNNIDPHLQNKKEYQIILKKQNETLNHFLKRIETYCNNNIDLLFINTIQETLKDLPHYFTFHPQCKQVLTIHDANTWLKPTIQINPLRPIRTIDTLLSTLLIKKYILPRFEALNVISPTIKTYIQENTTYKKPIFTLPFMIYEEKNIKHTKKTTRPIHFVIPGEIIQNRRNHKLIIDAFEHLFPTYDKKIKLTLLGRPRGRYGEHIHDRCTKLKDKGYDIQLFTKFVPETTYQEILNNADLIITSLKLHTTSLGTIPEIFGTTKASGITYEAIRHAKPLAVPKEMQLIQQMKTSAVPYTTTKDLIQSLSTYIADPSYRKKLQKNAQKNAEQFSLTRYQKYFEKEVLSILHRL